MDTPPSWAAFLVGIGTIAMAGLTFGFSVFAFLLNQLRQLREEMQKGFLRADEAREEQSDKVQLVMSELRAEDRRLAGCMVQREEFGAFSLRVEKSLDRIDAKLDAALDRRGGA
jgi:hypothetical protein